MKRVLVAAAAAICLSASASPHFGLHLASIHSSNNTGPHAWNNINPGGYVHFDNGATFGAYYNSERRVSVYAGYTHSLAFIGLPTVDISWVAISGYGGVKFGPMPSWRVTPHVRLGFIPKLAPNGAAVLHLMYEF